MGRDGGNKGGRPGEERGGVIHQREEGGEGSKERHKGRRKEQQGREECSCQQPSMMM